MAIGSDFWSAGQSTWWMHVACVQQARTYDLRSSIVQLSLLYLGETQRSNQSIILRRV